MERASKERGKNLSSTLRELLKSSEAHLEALFNHTMHGVITVNKMGVIESFNPAAEDITGYAAEEAMGKAFWELLSDPQQGIDSIFTEDLQQIDAQKVGQKYELTARHKNGSLRNLELRVIRVGHLQEPLYLGIFHDLTLRKKIEQSLHNTNIILDTITRVESQFIIQKNKADLNDIFQQLLTSVLAVTKGEHGLIAQISFRPDLTPEVVNCATADPTWKEAMSFWNHPDKIEDPNFRLICPYIHQVISSEEPIINNHLPTPEQMVGHTAKTPKYFMGIPLINKDTLVGVLVITDRKRPFDEETIHFILPILQACIIIIEDYDLEFERNRTKEELKERDEKLTSYVKTLAIKNRELEVARDQALSASRAKSAFLANISHEIRTPLNGILGMTELLLNTKLDERQKNFADTVYKSGEILLSLINDILDISKIEAGQLRLENISFDLAHVLEETMEMLRPQAQEKSLDLHLEYPPEIPKHLFSDPYRVRQVITNLIGNAIKFSKEGRVQCRASITKNAQGKSFVRVEVADMGIGIPKEKQALLFENFSQADTSTTRKYGGTGLGLSICKQLVYALGGEIGLESEEEEGATFWFTLPLMENAVHEENIRKI